MCRRVRGRILFKRMTDDAGGAGGVLADPLGGLDLRVDPWSVEQGAEVQVDPDAADDAAEVRLDVERPPEAWAPVLPREVPLPRSICFVDGVRRIDLRVMRVHTEAGAPMVFYGAFGSHAVGAVEVRPSALVSRPREAAFLVQRVGRSLLIGGGHEVPDVPLEPGVVYLGEAIDINDPTQPQIRLHRQMRVAEEQLGRELADVEGRLVVMDGPLSFEDKKKGLALGAIKRLHELYLPRELWPLLVALGPGERTPVFHIGGRYPRYSWFVRLARNGPSDPPWSGLMRMELHEHLGAEGATRLADLSAAALPTFSPARGQDPRAPQNLLPIGALEHHLRRALGDQMLIRRHLETLVRRPRENRA